MIRHVALAVLVAVSLHSGDLDPAFGDHGKTVTNVGGGGGAGLKDATTLPNGAILVLADGSQGRDDEDLVVVRYRPNGTVDPTFGDRGFAVADIEHRYDLGTSVLVQPDGRIVAGGYSAQTLLDPERGQTEGYDFVLARFTAAGALDPAFGTAGVVRTHLADENVASSYTLLDDGGILLAGATYPRGQPSALTYVFVKYTANGTRDSSFGTDGVEPVPPGAVGTVLVLPGNAGFRTLGTRDGHLTETRFRADGTVEGSTDSGVPSRGAFVTLAGDRIVVLNETPDRTFDLLRLRLDGTVDETFRVWRMPTLYYTGIVVAADGRIVVESTGGKAGWEATRRLPDGRPDTEFGNANGTTTGQADQYNGTRSDRPLVQGDRVVLTGTTGLSQSNTPFPGQVTLLGFLGHTPRRRTASPSATETTSSSATPTASASATPSTGATSASASATATAGTAEGPGGTSRGNGSLVLVGVLAAVVAAGAGAGAWFLVRRARAA